MVNHGLMKKGATSVRFTVGITTHNRPRLLLRAIESVVSLGWPGTEVIVVDDASTDLGYPLLGRYAAAVKYLYHQTQLGPNACRIRILQ